MFYVNDISHTVVFVLKNKIDKKIWDEEVSYKSKLRQWRGALEKILDNQSVR